MKLAIALLTILLISASAGSARAQEWSSKRQDWRDILSEAARDNERRHRERIEELERDSRERSVQQQLGEIRDRQESIARELYYSPYILRR